MKLPEYLKFDEEVNLALYNWLPQNPKGVVYFAHGMAEHLGRYERFASELVSHGYACVGVDLYGHGKSSLTEKIGQVTKYDFMDAMVKSIKLVVAEIFPLFGEAEFTLFAHSMSSFVAQRYLEIYPNDFSKVILSGADCHSLKYSLSTLFPAYKQNKELIYSKFVHNLGVGSFNKKFVKDHESFGWLSTDLDEVNKYANDPLCGAIFPNNYYTSLGKMLSKSVKQKELKKINPSLSILIIAGNDDPVGNFSRGPKKLLKQYTKLGLKVTLKLYEGRHELLNEKTEIRTQVIKDCLKFIESGL